MNIEIGKPLKAKFNLLVKTFMFECGDNGIVMEKDKEGVTLYATNGAHNVMYCKIPMGSNGELRSQTYVFIAYSDTQIIVDAGRTHVVIDYEDRVATSSKPGCVITGSKAWGDDVQVEWDEEFEEFFA